MRRDGLLLSVWTLDSKIFVKTSPEGSPIKINEIEDLETIYITVSTMKDGSASLKGERLSCLSFLSTVYT